MIVSLIIFIIASVLLCVAVWNALAWPRVGTLHQPHGDVSILIPARDEEANIAACLDAALMQTSRVREILVYDDHSRDETARVVAGYERRDARVRLIQPSALPDGWCGKNFACERMAAEARSEWLLFLDADARLIGNDAASRIASEAERREATLLSCWPALEMRGFWEGALMPMLNFIVFTLFPAPLSFVRVDASLGLAHGSCLLVRRDAYQRTGGHALVRGEIFEDTLLARAWRERGEKSLCVDGQQVVRVRMYGSFGEIWQGFRKNFFPAFRQETSFWAFVALHFFVLLLPFALAPFALAISTRAVWPLIAAALCTMLARLILALRFKHPLWSVALHPLGEIFLIALGLASRRASKSARGVEWKGRRLIVNRES